MSDRMVEKVGRAICRARKWEENGFWKTAVPDARAALDACHYEELVDLVRRMSGDVDVAKWTVLLKEADDLLAKVGASDG